MLRVVEKRDHQVVPLRAANLEYRSVVWDLSADPDRAVNGPDRWDTLKRYMVVATIEDSGTSGMSIGVSFDSGNTFSDVYDSGAAMDNLNTPIPITSTGQQIQIRVVFSGDSTVDFSEESLEDVDGRLVVLAPEHQGRKGQVSAFVGRSPVPPGSPGIPGRRLDFIDADKDILVAHCVTKEKGFWHVRLPYGNYEVKSGRATVMKNLVVGTASQIMQKRMSAVANQEERANIYTDLGDLPWGRFCLYDTFEDTSKVGPGASDGIGNRIRFSRLWAENNRWVERLAVFIQVE